MRGYFAHKREDGSLQTVREHLEGTARLAGEFAAGFDAAEQGKLAGMAHDIGKYSEWFQKRLLDHGPKVDHSTAGAFECIKLGQVYAAICIAGHHGGLPDLGTRDDRIEGTFWGRINRAKSNAIPDYASWKNEIKLERATNRCLPMKNSLAEMFYIRMLYSCLVDADFLDTERFMQNGTIHREIGDSLQVLQQKLEKYIENVGWYEPQGEINKRRSMILKSCLQKASLSQGIFTLSVPTGGGKTISSLAFSLKHAVENHMDRIIYVIPYTSIIEQTADVFRHILGEENVLEHHSGVSYDPDDCVTEFDVRMSLASENWDAPIIVTTAVQFFESLFANRSSKCRKLHNIANSVIIFDEAQMLPIPYLRACVYAMAQLSSLYHSSIMLCTATQPALEGLFSEFMEKYYAVELCPAHLIRDPVFSRTVIQRGGDMTWEEVAEAMNRRSQVLCIVNSRSNAGKVYDKLEGEGSFYLSTLLIPAHRKEKIKEIRRRLLNGETCRVVSTSLIEAGVDVDFPFVFREEAGIDSVIQAAGRCNREGKRAASESIVSVFHPENRPPAIFKTNIDVGRMILKKYDDVASQAAVYDYFRELFSLKGENAFDKNDIIKKSGNGNFPFRTIAEEFHLIDNATETVYIPWGEGVELIQKKLSGEMSRTLNRKLNFYAVNIYEKHFKELLGTGDIRPFEDGSWYLSNTSLYNEETGLSMEADYGKAEFI